MTITIKKILAMTLVVAVALITSAPYARAENENASTDHDTTTISSSHQTEKRATKTQLKTRSKKVTKKKTKKHATVSKTPITTVTTAITSAPSISYSMAEVATANTKSKCWTVISGKVYNLTDWITQHPGGEGAILSICGKDGTTAFNAQHGGQGRPAQELTTFLIGTLKQ